MLDLGAITEQIGTFKEVTNAGGGDTVSEWLVNFLNACSSVQAFLNLRHSHVFQLFRRKSPTRIFDASGGI